MQVVAPGVSEKLPGGHWVQLSREVAPTPLLAVPRGQGMHRLPAYGP